MDQQLLSPTLGRLIRLARLEAKLTQTELAKAADTIQSTISSWENGKSRPRVPQLVRLADVLRVDLQALIDAVRADEERDVSVG